jgi:glycosyltransferase involved in cell wall biosynthesis
LVWQYLMQLPLLIVFSHLRWGFVYQRPQHLLSRLAGRWRVLFVEEPVNDQSSAHLEEQLLGKHLTLLVPHTPLATPGFHDDQLALLQSLLSNYLVRFGPVEVAWLYTPMALPLVQAVNPTCVVYDCMDELAAFNAAPRQLRQRESVLMKQAAVVLTGGPSLYEARRDQHHRVVCLPSAVDGDHYAADRLKMDSPMAHRAQFLQGRLPRPRLGYFGVIDERMDLELLAMLADTHPQWSIVMVGPVVKIDQSTLPRRPNIHWLGMQAYDCLPYLLEGWDLCLMPFAINESTKFISPTKTLEYMAGGKPVVSTPVRDVVLLYGKAVSIAPAGPAFVEACEAMLAEGPAARAQRSAEMVAAVSASSWGRSAEAVHQLLVEALAEARAQRARAATTPVDVDPVLQRAAAGGG